ncbi:MAG TPA: RcpC/CpaB family pilus assembly protein [Anaerolineales bacterium]
MRRGRILIFVILIIVIGLAIALFGLYQFMQSSQRQPQAQTVEVYVAGQNIPQGGAINESVLSTISVPQDKVVSVMFTRDELAQLTTNKIAKFPLDQGVVITESMVVDKSVAVAVEGPAWAALVPPGMTAIAIPSSRLALAGYAVADGAHVNMNVCLLFVDVDPSFQTRLPNNVSVLTGTGVVQNALPVLSLSAAAVPVDSSNPQGRLELDPSLQQPFYLTPSEKARPRTVCQLLLQDVVVLKVGNFPLTQAVQQAQQPEGTQPPPPDMVTLVVSPQDAITISYLTYTNAQIQLALRNPSDNSRQATEATTLQFLLSQYNIPVPAKLPYSLEPRIDALIPPVLPNDSPSVTQQQPQ